MRTFSAWLSSMRPFAKIEELMVILMIMMMESLRKQILVYLICPLCSDMDRKEIWSMSPRGLLLLVRWRLPHLGAGVPFELSVPGAVLMRKERISPSFPLAESSSAPQR